MTAIQWIRHLWAWIKSFPLFRDDDHLWIGLVGEEKWDCWICDAHREDSNG